jgi:hypothetical protein
VAVLEALSESHSPEISELAQFFNETLDFTPNSVLTMQPLPMSTEPLAFRLFHLQAIQICMNYFSLSRRAQDTGSCVIHL